MLFSLQLLVILTEFAQTPNWLKHRNLLCNCIDLFVGSSLVMFIVVTSILIANQWIKYFSCKSVVWFTVWGLISFGIDKIWLNKSIILRIGLCDYQLYCIFYLVESIRPISGNMNEEYIQLSIVNPVKSCTYRVINPRLYIKERYGYSPSSHHYFAF